MELFFDTTKTSIAAGLRSRRFISRRKIRNAFLMDKTPFLKNISSNRYNVDFHIKKYYINVETNLQPLINTGYV